MRSDLAQSYGHERLPRYTSYPTAPHFSPAIGEPDYRMWLGSLPPRQPASIYVHVPFCRSMCWYCGCRTSVTKKDNPIAVYTSGLRAEAHLIAETIGHRLPISHINFGGGTPTIMTPETFADLVGALRFSYFVLPDAEIAVEIDPRTLTEPIAAGLGYSGVNRASLGVQSFDPVVQRAINRVQTFEQTATCVERLRQAGVGRLNFNLIYGLPLQTMQSCLDTVAKCIELRPDRLWVFSYAHMPSFKKHQAQDRRTRAPPNSRAPSSVGIDCGSLGRRGLRAHWFRPLRPTTRQSCRGEARGAAASELPGLHRRHPRNAHRARGKRHREDAARICTECRGNP
ncbi:coproporphyrinogen III oxidase-like Fe-S oxidoreductase [Bradyrhizobium sp. i1.7.7]